MDRNSVAVERRRAIRRMVSSDEPLSRGKLRTGSHLRIVDASSWGALAELTERLLPGRHLDLHVVSATGRALVRVRVVRAFVSQLRADAVLYRAALAFDRSLDIREDGYSMPAPLSTVPSSPGTRYPAGTVSTEIAFEDGESG